MAYLLRGAITSVLLYLFYLGVTGQQDVFHERVKTYKAWKDEEIALNKKREAKVKLELAHKSDKVSAVTHEITEVSCTGGIIFFVHAIITDSWFHCISLHVCCSK